jgi:hypothetical protein
MMTKALGGFNAIMRTAAGAASSAGSRVGSAFSRLGAGASSALGDLSHATNVMRGTVSAVAGIAGAVGGMVRGGVEWVVGAASFRESTLTGLRTVLGSQEAANRVFAESQRMAQQTPFDTADVIRDRMNLILNHFTESESRVLYAAGADIGTALGQDRMEPFFYALQRIKGQGALTGEAMHSLRAAGIGESLLFPALARRLNISTDNQRQMMAAVRQRMSAGHIDGDMALSAIVDAVERNISHGTAGSFAVGQSETISGLLSNLRSAPSDLVQSMDMLDTPGFRAFKNGLKNVIAMLAPASASGKRLMDVLEKMVNGVFKVLFGDLSDPAALSRAFDGAITAVERFIPVLVTGLENIKQFGLGIADGFMTALGAIGAFDMTNNSAQWREFGVTVGALAANLLKLIAPLATVAGWINSIGEGIGKAAGWLTTDTVGAPPDLDAMRAQHRGIGTVAGAGFNDGLMNSALRTQIAARTLADASTVAMQDRLQVHSPSRVFMRLGQNTAQGFAEGLRLETPTIESALTGAISMNDAPTASSMAGRGGLNASGMNVNVNVNVGPEHGNPQAIAQEVARVLPSTLQSALEGLALQAAAA